MSGAQSLFRLDGKTALVTAGAGGFGQAISLGLAESGANVMVTDIDETAAQSLSERIRSHGSRSLSAACDVTDAAQIEEVVQRTLKEFGQIDILVNIACAAVLTPILEMSESDFERTMSSCLRAAFLLSKSVGREMVSRGAGGSIVHISSIAGSRALGRGTGIYAASKAGVNALVRELAVELGPHQIRVNAVAPCQFRTPPLLKLLDNPKFGGREQLAAKMTSRIPLGRMGEPEELVGPCLFLASEAASMVTGHVLFVDGGFMAY